MDLWAERTERAERRAPEPASRWTNAFLRLVATLAVRPRWRDRPLPLIWLTGGGGGAVLDTLAGRLTSPGRYQVPHARLTASPATDAESAAAARPAAGTRPGDGTRPPAGARPDDGPRPAGARPAEGAETEIRPLLDRLCRKLSRPTFGTGRLWFRRYALAAWLLDQDLSGWRSDDIPGELARRLRGRSRPRHQAELSERRDLSGEGLFGVFAVLSWLLSRLVPQVVFRVAISGRVPAVGRRYRWFMRQHYLAPAQSGTFLGFAERLTAGRRDDEPPDQIDKLLLHAFLEDLRHAYLRRPWRVQSRRRTAYPIVMIDEIVPGSAGHTLLRLVNDVRNETGRNDPLLAVCAGDRPPPPRAAPAIEPDDLESAYQGWAKALPRKRRARGPGAWIWSIDESARAATQTGSDMGRAGGGGPPGFVPPKPPWFARRTVAAAACLVVAGSVGGIAAVRSGWPGCGHSPLDRDVSVHEIGGQCIGLSASNGLRFNDQLGQKLLVDVQRRIFARNQEARDQWEASGRHRPLVTLVYLGTLTGRKIDRLPDEEAYAAEREDLEGLAVAQYDGIRTSGVPSKPLLRVVVANAGFQMRYATEAAKMIRDLARRDRTLIGVVGLVESRKVTGEALRLLNDAGILAVAPTLSADGMYGYSKLYLQVSAPNLDQARLVERYASTVLRVRGVRVYYTLGKDSERSDDHYVDTMLGGLERVFGRRLESVDSFDGETSMADDCGYRGMVFFAGRWTEFGRFVERLSRSCGDDPPDHVVADDSVNRYMANPKSRRLAPGNIPLTYVSKGWLATCGPLGRRTDEEAARKFSSLLREPDLLPSPRCDPARPHLTVGERVGLSYDSAMIVLRAVQDLADQRPDPPPRWDPRSIDPVRLHDTIHRRHRATPFSGVTGDIRFDDHGEPVDKMIFLVRANSIPERDVPPTLVFRCGSARQGDPATCREP